jgi:signal transduction histidine kinase
MEREDRQLNPERQAAELARIMYDTMPQGVTCHDADGRIISANPAALSILGTTIGMLKKLTGHQLELCCVREDGTFCPWHEQPTVLALRSGITQKNVVMKVYNRRNLSHRLLKITAVPFYPEGKTIRQAYTLFEDITEQREAQRSQQEMQLSLAQRGSDDAFWDWNREKNLITYSQRWWTMLGYQANEIPDEPDLWRRMIHPDDQPRVGRLLGAALAGSTESLQLKIRLRHKLGHCLYVVSRIFIERDADGKAERIYGANVDLTDRLHLAAELRQYQKKLEMANESLEQRVAERTEDLETAIRELESFCYSVSHDLRAPLRHINSFSAILLEDYGAQMPAGARPYLYRICLASSGMGSLIDALLEISRVSRTPLNLEEVSLSELAEQIFSMHREIDPRREVRVVIREGVTVLGDRALLRQLLQNLIGNAWKYSSQKPVARIEFGVLIAGGEEAFFVRDDGVGFDMQYQERLFSPFERLHGSEFEGTGIGLATAQRIVRRHGGSIRAEGKLGQGATVYFTLPVYY